MRPQLNPLILGPGAPWSLPGSSLDIQFTTGRAAVNRQTSSISSLLTTTRASTGYATTSTGSLTLFPTNTPRITDLGLLVEEARTNVVLWDRDLTNAAWIKTNITTALDQIGVDGTANSATSLTATAGNGTCLQAITLASSARFQSAYVKRITGSGTINMTMDNGATWTAINVTSSYTRLSIPTQTLANPTVGFRVVTNGDAIAIDFVQNENGTFATSPTATTTVSVTRAADIINLAGVALTAAINSKSVLITTNLMSGSATPRAVDFNGVQQLRWSSTTIVNTDNGVNTGAQATIGGAGTYAGLVKYAAGFDANGYTARANGGTQVSDTTHAWGSMSGPVTLGNGPSGDRTHPINGYMLRLVFGPVKGQFDGLTI